VISEAATYLFACRQQALKSAPRSAGAEVVSTGFLDQTLITVNDPIAALDPGFRGNPVFRLLLDSKKEVAELVSGFHGALPSSIYRAAILVQPGFNI
jgi:hypothetical protein